MTITQSTCDCNPTTSGASGLTEPCSCGCCDRPAPTKEQRIAELRVLRDDLDQQLANLENA